MDKCLAFFPHIARGPSQARAAVLAALRTADRMSDLARLMWLVEDLIYDDLLKGTGWGRRRGWYREQLESSRTISQVRYGWNDLGSSSLSSHPICRC